MAILSKYKLQKYQYGIDVQKLRQLYGMSGKIINYGRWLSERTDQIIVVEMNEVITEREAQFYLEVNGHNNIIRTLGYIQNTSNLTIFIQEFAQEGDLADMLLDTKFVITQPILMEMFVQIADAMNYVTSKKIIHGDLGCRNVLVFRVDPSEPKNNLVKITDFGLARWIYQPPTREDPTIIPIRYCAPEILEHNRHSNYSEKSDVYSMGVLIWEALSNSEMPYSSVEKDEDVKQMKLRNKRLPKPPVCDRQLWKLMKECWHNDPQNRPNFEYMKNILANMEVSEVPDDQRSVSLKE
jgi:serine/threonine protein kinase